MSTGALLTIISGTPGAGKTALAVSMLMEERERNPQRPVFVMGIPDLSIPHELVPPVGDWTVERPHPDDPTIVYPEFTFPDGALVIIDEAQNAFRPRSQGSKVPPHVAAMERHRHKGLDFWLISQHPTMIDSNIRKLCGKHLHLRSLWSGGQLLEWSEAADPNNVGDRSKASSRRYSPPKKVFGLYKSSSMHVKRSRRLPFAVYLFVVVLILGGVMTVRMYDRISTAIAGGKPAPVSSPQDAQTWAKAGATGSPAQPGYGAPAVALSSGTGGVSVEDWTPRIRTRPETAPIYDGIRQVRSLPVVAGCIASATRCTCVTEQGTDAFLDDGECRAWLEKPPFNPWLDPRADREPVAARAAPVVTPDPGV